MSIPAPDGAAYPAAGDGQIVVPVDLSHGSWRALPVARSIGRRLGRRVSLLFVDTSTLGPHAVLESSVTLRASIDGEPVSIDVVPGADVATTIRQIAAQRDGSVVVMSTHGLGGFAARAWGSVCGDLLRSDMSAVVTVGSRVDVERHQDTERVVVCVDPVAPDHSMVREVLGWAEALDVPMTIVAPTGRAHSGASVESARRVLTTLRDELASPGTTVDSEVIDGADVAAAIVRYADRSPGVLLAMSVGGQGGVALLTRRVVATVARDSSVPMLLGWDPLAPPTLPVQRTRQSLSVEPAVSTACHDSYDHDEQPVSEPRVGTTAGTECHDDYGFEYTSFSGDRADLP